MTVVPLSRLFVFGGPDCVNTPNETNVLACLSPELNCGVFYSLFSQARMAPGGQAFIEFADEMQASEVAAKRDIVVHAVV